MPSGIDRHEVQRLMREEGAQIVEVLPSKELADDHLPGAISLPLRELSRQSADRHLRRRLSARDRLAPEVDQRAPAGYFKKRWADQCRLRSPRVSVVWTSWTMVPKALRGEINASCQAGSE